ncbi:MAG: hypothetical protein RL479_2654 [Verrucomicrobiota bacterium]
MARINHRVIGMQPDLGPRLLQRGRGFKAQVAGLQLAPGGIEDDGRGGHAGRGDLGGHLPSLTHVVEDHLKAELLP